MSDFANVGHEVSLDGRAYRLKQLTLRQVLEIEQHARTRVLEAVVPLCKGNPALFREAVRGANSITLSDVQLTDVTLMVRMLWYALGEPEELTHERLFDLLNDPAHQEEFAIILPLMLASGKAAEGDDEGKAVAPPEQ